MQNDVEIEERTKFAPLKTDVKVLSICTIHNNSLEQ